jgi:hypothetical protein
MRTAGPSRSQDRRAASMPRELVTHNKPVFDQIHPNIHGAAVGLVAWFAVAA